MAAVLRTDDEEKERKLAIGIMEVRDDGTWTRVAAVGGVRCGSILMYLKKKMDERWDTEEREKSGEPQGVFDLGKGKNLEIEKTERKGLQGWESGIGSLVRDL